MISSVPFMPNLIVFTGKGSKKGPTDKNSRPTRINLAKRPANDNLGLGGLRIEYKQTIKDLKGTIIPESLAKVSRYVNALEKALKAASRKSRR